MGLANHTLLARDGTERPIDATAAPIRDDKGHITGVVLIFKDVTERKQAEETLQRAHDELEIRVRERTAELAKTNEILRDEITERKRAEEQLVQSAKLAGLGQLGAGIAHELNQPITIIQGFTQRIRRNSERQAKDHADELDLIINASHRMARIVDNIRLFSRQSNLA